MSKIYERPSKRLHRGFVYLDDDTVINSLSAMEAGQVDEVVARIVSAREGKLGVGVKTPVFHAGGDGEKSSSLEEEMTRRRTRFSVFEIWYQKLKAENALGRFNGWGPDALDQTEPGDTVELAAQIQMQHIQVLSRLYLWYAQVARKPGTPLSVPQKDHKEIKDSEQVFKLLLGPNDGASIYMDVTPNGDSGPRVSMELTPEWAVLPLGKVAGQYQILGQVEQILGDRDSYPVMRLTHDVPATNMELTMFKESLSGFGAAAQQFGLEIRPEDAELNGPAMVIRPIAIYR